MKHRMKKTGILISYFAKREEAREAFGKLQRKGHRRVAWVSKSAAGKVQTRDPFRRRRLWGAVVAFVLFGALAEAVSMWPAPMRMGVRWRRGRPPGCRWQC